MHLKLEKIPHLALEQSTELLDSIQLYSLCCFFVEQSDRIPVQTGLSGYIHDFHFPLAHQASQMASNHF